ncbi:hypothetical protein [Bradyrhizobium sp. WSM1417]|uniref:hypothetical protein n=1 Tax=Bradyrhizobium sp. WSM1417 TaxID=754500 RepID=UPI0004858FBC|nr:hypothetical protein [Bradyrhizobium sp. WSM1417]
MTRLWLRPLLVGIMVNLDMTGLKAAEAIVLPSSGDSCKSLATGSEFNAWRCPGPAGYSLVYNDSVMHAELTLAAGLGGKPSDREGVEWDPAALGIGSRIEWRMTDGKPFAAIVGRWRRAEEDTSNAAVIEELLVVKVTENGGCAVATVGALTYDAADAAREIADLRARTFRCGIDQLALDVNAGNSTVNHLDFRFGEHETLEHNGSLVKLSHSPSGEIEIRYLQPRRSLRVEPGTVLFRGHERAGKISGSAFLFKEGCAPAEYAVSGRRTDGVLVLEGVAPRREPRSCAAMMSAPSKSSRLVFTHEPLNEAMEVSQERLGMAQCGQCMSATVTAMQGVGTEHAHVTAAFTSEDRRDYCENWNVEPDRIATCLKDNAGDRGKVQEASANCKDLTVRPSSGGEYRFSRLGTDYGGPAPNWTDLATGKVECGARSCNSATATAQFTMLCPQAIPGWTGRRF